MMKGMILCVSHEKVDEHLMLMMLRMLMMLGMEVVVVVAVEVNEGK